MAPNNTNNQSRHPVESVSPFQWWDYPIFFMLSAAMLYAILNFIIQWWSIYDLTHTPVSYIILSLILATVLINAAGRWFLLMFMKRPLETPITREWRVAVITSFVAQSEGPAMLETTLEALVLLDYPHDTWVLDESDNDEIKALCKKHGVKHFSRKHKAHYQRKDGRYKKNSKHGNYNAWFNETGFSNYDIISAFDPDHIPVPEFLSKTLGYFEHPEVGYVQVAQAYYNQNASFIARGAAEETYAYYSSIEMSSYAMGYPIIIGSHNTHRVSALKKVGGLAAHDADDLLLTRRYQNQGTKGVYVPEILARGLTPVDWAGYLGQQRRWCRSVLDLKLRSYPDFTEEMNFAAKAYSVLHGLTYLHKSLILIILQFLLIYLLLSGESPQALSPAMVPFFIKLWAVLLICELYRQRFYIDWIHEWGTHWRAGLLQLGKCFYMLFALYEVLAARNPEYTLTLKIKSGKDKQFLLWPNLLMLILISTAWLIGTLSGQVSNPVIHICALVFVTLSAVLVYTETLDSPEPFDKALLAAQTQLPANASSPD